MKLDPKKPPKNDLNSPRIWIYVVMIVGGMIWGVNMMLNVLRDAH